MKIFLAISDNGDGSSSIQFFKDEEKVKWAVDNLEDFYANEGDYKTLEVTSVEGIRFADDYVGVMMND